MHVKHKAPTDNNVVSEVEDCLLKQASIYEMDANLITA
jgi:hypothetical protein